MIDINIQISMSERSSGWATNYGHGGVWLSEKSMAWALLRRREHSRLLLSKESKSPEGWQRWCCEGGMLGLHSAASANHCPDLLMIKNHNLWSRRWKWYCVIKKASISKLHLHRPPTSWSTAWSTAHQSWVGHPLPSCHWTPCQHHPHLRVWY